MKTFCLHTEQSDKMPSDFDRCRFDFRIDSKKGLMPSRRKGRAASSSSAAQAPCPGVVDSTCTTLYSCKQCGDLLSSRQSLVQHRLLRHRPPSTAKGYKPPPPPSWTSNNNKPIGVTSSSSMASSLSSENDALSPPPLGAQLTIDLTMTSSSSSPLLGGADRSPSIIQRYINALSRVQQTTTTTSLRDTVPTTMTSSRCSSQSLPAADGDVISASSSSRVYSHPSTTSFVAAPHLKCRHRGLLDKIVERLWRHKLTAAAVDHRARTLTTSNTTTTASCSSQGGERGCDEGGDGHQRLLLRRVTAAPGTEPQFYTSLMRMQSIRHKERTHQQQQQRRRRSNIGRLQIACSLRHSPLGGDIADFQQTVHPSAADAMVTTASVTSSSLSTAEPVINNAPAAAAASHYRCDFDGCRRIFRELKHLKVHRMQHTDERPLACSLCNYACRQRNSLNWHMKSRHGLAKHVTQDGRTVYR